MKILFAASECIPFIKTGGLADVVGTLAPILKKEGADVRVMLPKYSAIPAGWKNKMEHVCHFHIALGWRSQYCGIEKLEHEGVIYYFVDNEYYFARDYIYGSGNDEGERFSFFCRAVLESLPKLGFFPDILHCNDWQTGMVPALLSLQYRELPDYREIRTVFTIHNLRYQGIFPWGWINEMLSLGDAHFNSEELEYYGCVSFMKAGIRYAWRVSTVSPSYADEIRSPEYGERLDGLLRARGGDLWGILNGIDEAAYDPAADPALTAHFSCQDASGKLSCKADLQRELSLEANPKAPLIAMITRLTEQKGLDLVKCVWDDIMACDAQFVVLGLGEEDYVRFFEWQAQRYSGRVAARFMMDDALARRIYAGSDLFLMPSRFEPCGLSQMIALRYGTVPLVRETGGLRDTVRPYNRYTGEGTGFSFANYNAHEMLYILRWAIECYKDNEIWSGLVKRGMRCDFSWSASARDYLRMYASMMG